MKKDIIYKGAEAEICVSKYMNYNVVEKRRVHKSYRINYIDDKLISSRTREEAKLMIEARNKGVSVPIIYDVDLISGIITMEYLTGKRIKDILNNLSEKKRQTLCKKIGESIARFHNNDIIHGDITTSNMILLDDKVHFIDFGLGEKNSEIESKGVDLHVLMEALESTHSKYSDCFKYVLEGYKKELKDDANQVIKKIDEIVKRGRYR
ncbi:MAG: Kae1-associated kinase Bud32 [Thermoplasmata archaeon M9B1D]|nr:MAG: Kae1-associated kinase Bud32 [Thermoplasmata archaeon M9B1D]PNX51178.1 MAG: Kae1-associated kinase Bud32 [Thermoplasmata archaeon M8B2D]